MVAFAFKLSNEETEPEDPWRSEAGLYPYHSSVISGFIDRPYPAVCGDEDVDSGPLACAASTLPPSHLPSES